MKKIILSALILLCAFVISQAQTTEEEYNYVTKGYKVQVESGLDVKKGYEVKDIERETSGDRTADLKALYRIKDTNREVAAYMIVYEKKGTPVEYICIPHPRSDQEMRLKRFWTQLYNGKDSSEKLQLIAYLLSRNLKW